MIRYIFPFIFVSLMLVACGGGNPLPPAPITISDVTAFLATARCSNGMPAVVSTCSDAAPQKSSDFMLYRRHDWSGHTDGQIEDTYFNDNGNYFVNTFSYPPNGLFNASNGDGGDVMVTDGTTVRIIYTQNGNGVGGTAFNYWVGYNCGGTSWLLFDNAAPTGSWRGQIAYLNSAATSGACPSLNAAWTQWRLETAGVPFIMPDGSQQTVSMPIVISEHYGSSSIATAKSMERVIMGKGVGRILWESWTTKSQTNATFACPGIVGWSDAPAPGWYLQDRRCLTQIKADDQALSGDLLGWPGSGFMP